MSVSIYPPTTGTPVNERRLEDAQYTAIVVPVAGLTTAGTTSFDLRQGTPWPVTERVLAVVSAAGTFSTAGTLSVQWYDSADNSTFASIGEMGALTINSGNYQPTVYGYLWTNGTNYVDRWQFPPTVRQYVRVSVTASSAFSPGTGEVVYKLWS